MHPSELYGVNQGGHSLSAGMGSECIVTPV